MAKIDFTGIGIEFTDICDDRSFFCLVTDYVKIHCILVSQSDFFLFCL